MLIDWLTLRTKISDLQESELLELIPYLAKMEITNLANDQVIQTKLVIDIDAVRSDFQGLVWSISSNGRDKYLNIGGSPASIENGSNLFGSGDYQHCKKIIIKHAQKALRGCLVPSSNWHPRRIDITQNYFLQSRTQVKDALHMLRASDGMRQKSTVKGDSIYWGESSKYRKGKAYDKHTQAKELIKRAEKLKNTPPYTPEQLKQMENILRLELTLGRQWFDEHPNEDNLKQDYLIEEHEAFFTKFIGDSEVSDMDTLFKNLQLTAPSIGIARSAYSTYLMIKQNGYHHTFEHMKPRTFYMHKKALLSAGLCEADLTNGNIIELRKRKITMTPVYNWEHLQELHKEAA